MNWNNKRYHNLDYELKKVFGEKTIKLSINGGFTCPNRDGTAGERGCIFCSEKGSGEFAGDVDSSISRQIEDQINYLSKKWKTSSYIAYFQSYSNTYDTVQNLEKKYSEALGCENIKGLAIATRPDCIDENIAKLLSELNKKTYLWIELGLQTIHDSTAKDIRRGYSLNVFDETLKLLNKYNIKTVVHLILGLPGESKTQILESLRYISDKKIWGVKLHLLHILKNTDLEKLHQKTNFKILSQEEYVNLVCDCIELLPEDIVIHRITGDGKRSELVSPSWSLNKKQVLNDIDYELLRRNTYQGKMYKL